MKHVFIAIGGSGTKVAEALVKLLAVGFPTRFDNGYLTSAGDKLEIWRIDPDQGAGAQEDLTKCLEAYQKLQSSLSDGNEGSSLASSRWAMDIETRVRELNPLELPNANENQMKTLSGILDSGHAHEKSLALLAPFYEKKDLDVWVDRGFYQKPFIGAAIMSVFARSLEDDGTPSGKKAGLTAFSNTPTNFFLCGSLHGGTGACGVPVMAQFLSRRKNANPGWGWRIGGGLLAPFVKPPMPPFSPLREGDTIDDDDINQLIEVHGNSPAFQAMNTPEEKRELVRQILLGFYADPDDMEARARQGLTFYQDHSADYFDELYLVGKPSPNQLKVWSNGGKSQKNPLNSADMVAAVAALNFFAQAGSGDKNSYIIGSSNYEVPQENMRLAHVPSYRIGKEVEIDAEKVFLATALTCHLIRHRIPWNLIHENAKDFRICDYYDKRSGQAATDRGFYENSIRIMTGLVDSLIYPHQENFPTGWSLDELQQIRRYLDDNASSSVTLEIKNNMGKKFMRSEAKGANVLGQSESKFTDADFGAWCPPHDQFTRGEYFRHIWLEVYRRCQTRLGN
jgi:hypothetical protein